MGFFNPALLWFALGGAIPVIIHLLHRQKFRRVRWAAMEFLLAALRKTQRRMRLENLLLLLLRVLIMAVLALAVARPFFHEAPLMALGDSDTHHLFVMDVSYSMAYKRAQNTSLDVARKAAEALLKEIRESEQDRFTLLTMSSFPEALLKERNRKDQIVKALAELKPADYGTSVYATMLEIRALLDSTRNRDRRVYLFTDLQMAGWAHREEAEAKRLADLLKALSSRENTRFYLFDAGAPDPINHAVVDLRVDRRVVTTKRATHFHVELHNFSTTPIPDKSVSLYVDDNLFETKRTALPPNVTTTLTFRYDFAAAGPHAVRAALEPDYLDTDDQRHLALDVKSSIRGLVVDGEPGNRPAEGETFTYVMALDPMGRADYFSVDVKTVELFSAEGLEAYDFLVLANVQSLTGDKIEKVEQFVRRGGGLFITLGARVDKVSFNDGLWNKGAGLAPAQLEEITGVAPEGQLERGIERRIARFAIQHPIFRVFREQLGAAVYSLVFYKYYKVKDHDPDRVLAAFDDPTSSPLWLEKPFGEGKVLLMTSTLDSEWNAGIQAHPPYLVLMQEISSYLATRPAVQRNLFVGDLIQAEFPAELYQPPFTLETPALGAVTIPASAPEKEQKFFRLFYPARAKADDPRILHNQGVTHAGKYTLRREASREEEKLTAYFAVNVLPRSPTPDEIREAEGNLERISREELRRRFPEFKADFLGDRKEVQDVSAPPGSSLWKYLLYLALGFILLESVLAWLFGRSKQ